MNRLNKPGFGLAQSLPVGVFLLGTLLILATSVARYGSASIYSLDDAYIHLAF